MGKFSNTLAANITRSFKEAIANISKVSNVRLAQLAATSEKGGFGGQQQFTSLREALQAAAVNEQARRQFQQGVEIQTKTVQAVGLTVTKQFAEQEKRFMDIFMQQEKRLEEKTINLLTSLQTPMIESESQIKQNGQSPVPLIALVVVGALLLG